MEKYSKFQILESEIGNVGHKYICANVDERDTIRFTAVRGGWAWATDTSPFYCIIVGQQWFDEKLYFDTSVELEVIFEAIDEGLDLDRRFNNLADISALYKCNWYADTGPLHEPEVDSWYDFNAGRQYGDLHTGPWADSFRLGVELIKTGVRTHKISITKETEVFNQLQRITDKDLAAKEVKSRYFAIEALRHVVASFKRDPANLLDVDRTVRFDRGGAQGWML